MYFKIGVIVTALALVPTVVSAGGEIKTRSACVEFVETIKPTCIREGSFPSRIVCVCGANEEEFISEILISGYADCAAWVRTDIITQAKRSGRKPSRKQVKDNVHINCSYYLNGGRDD